MGTRKAADDKINEGKYTESVNNSRGFIVLVGTVGFLFWLSR